MRPAPPDRRPQLARTREELAAALWASALRIAQARAYLARPGCNVALGAARLAQLRGRRSALRAHLRASRIEAQEIDSFPYTQFRSRHYER